MPFSCCVRDPAVSAPWRGPGPQRAGAVWNEPPGLSPALGAADVGEALLCVVVALLGWGVCVGGWRWGLLDGDCFSCPAMLAWQW